MKSLKVQKLTGTLFTGHVFKSLIGTGLIPRQGRTVADRIDGVW